MINLFLLCTLPSTTSNAPRTQLNATTSTTVSQVVGKAFLDQVISPAHTIIVSTHRMPDPADLANTMDSLHLDPEAAKKIANLEEQVTRLESEKATLREQITRLDTEKATIEQEKATMRQQVTRLETEKANFGKETKILREMGHRQRDKIGELKGKLETAEVTIESNEAELDAANCTTEEYRVENNRLERHVDVDLLEKNVDLSEKNVNLSEENKRLTARNEVLEAQAESHAKDVDVEMQDAFEDLRPVCPHWAAGNCRHRKKCKFGRHPANIAEATTSTAGTHNTTGDLELQSAK
jgi:predicted  nucleic acid-binding Zn-ribbon protein